MTAGPPRVVKHQCDVQQNPCNLTATAGDGDNRFGRTPVSRAERLILAMSSSAGTCFQAGLTFSNCSYYSFNYIHPLVPPYLRHWKLWHGFQNYRPPYPTPSSGHPFELIRRCHLSLCLASGFRRNFSVIFLMGTSPTESTG